MKILVTGGLGYIGSHVTTLLLNKGINVICLDNLENSSKEVLNGIKTITRRQPIFKNFDIRDKNSLRILFDEHIDVEGVIHFAAYKSVEESVRKPLQYYQNNVGGLLNLIEILTKKEIPLIFSSSCTVYGQSKKLPISESEPFQPPTSPYGFTKQVGEKIIEHSCKAYPNFSAILLRYFNPIGAHPTAKIGENPQGIPQNLVPFLTQTVIGKHPVLKIFGSDYNTPDGTCIRDFIHVMDLAQAHINALEYCLKNKNKSIFNIGTGKGLSVAETVRIFEKSNSIKLNVEFGPRRIGDVAEIYSDTKKSNK